MIGLYAHEVAVDWKGLTGEIARQTNALSGGDCVGNAVQKPRPVVCCPMPVMILMYCVLRMQGSRFFTDRTRLS